MEQLQQFIDNPPTPILTAVDRVENAGPDFMKVVFGLKPGEVAIAQNYPKNLVYVVRLISLSPSDDQLLRSFVSAGPKNQLTRHQSASIGAYEYELLEAEWAAQLIAEFDFRWVKDAACGASDG